MEKTQRLKFGERIQERKLRKKALESANLCLDGAIKKLKEGKSPNSYLYQFCLQFKRYCKSESKLRRNKNGKCNIL